MCIFICIECKKISSGRSSSRGSSKRTSYKPQPAPTSFSYPQSAAHKPSLSGWQEKPATNTQSFSSWQSKSSGQGQGHSYPFSQTGLSGNSQPKQPPKYQETVQRNNAPQYSNSQQTRTNNQQSHSYPSSNSGLSGSSGTGNSPQTGSGMTQQAKSNYPQQQGGSYPQPNNGLSGSGPGVPYHQGQSQYTNNGNQYYHPQGPPPPYSAGNNFGGYGNYNPGYASQMPGYFGNLANNGRGFGGVSRTGSALTGVGIAGAGVGTLLTGLALWNLARSTGNRHHTVIYDNRGQPVAVAPANDSSPANDSFLSDLVNCTLTISGEKATEVLAIPCAIATSFSPDANTKDINSNNNGQDGTKCIVTVITKTAKEYMTTIPCSVLLNTAAENNVTEPPIVENEKVEIDTINSTTSPFSDDPNQAVALKLTTEGNYGGISQNNLNCTPEHGSIRDPINPCFAVNQNLTVIPISTTLATDVVK